MSDEGPLSGLSDDELKALGKTVGLDVTLPEKQLADELPAAVEVEEPSASDEMVVPDEEACFALQADGMPVALREIPKQERAWYWRDMRYRGHFIAPVGVQDPRHRYLFGNERERAFYVRNAEGVIGLVPFPNSTIVWPSDFAWAQSLAPENQTDFRADLKPSQQKKQKK